MGDDELNPFDGEAKFRFLTPVPNPMNRYKKRPADDYVPPPRREYQEYDHDEDYANRPLQQQIYKTLETMRQKRIYNDQIFFILDLSSEPNSSEIERILTKLDAEVLAYLNAKHTRVLVSASNIKLNQVYNKIPEYFENGIYVLRPISSEEQVSEELRLDPKITKKKYILIRIMPNLDKQSNSRYIRIIKTYLHDSESEVLDETLNNLGIVIARTNFATIQQLVNESPFILEVKSAPRGIPARAYRKTVRKKKGKSTARKRAVLNSLDPDAEEGFTKLPNIVVLDSGVNEINPLRSILTRFHQRELTGDDDETQPDGHGTPIAYLAAYGEEQDGPTARIISYKIYSTVNDSVAYQGMLDALEELSSGSHKSRLFVTSIALENYSLQEIRDLDRLAQKKNVCFVCSAGNIGPDQIIQSINSGISYPAFLERFPVLSPADTPSILAVGSLSRIATQTSIAPTDSVSPHSRCGSSNGLLYDCIKPEIIESGGNVNIVGGASDPTGMGVASYNSHNIYRNPSNFVGTSFSSPIFIRRLARLLGKYPNISYPETLKAIALISARKLRSTCSGYGVGRTFTGCDRDHALYVAEDEIQLTDQSGFAYIDSASRIPSVIVPKGVNRIEMCLVHSDDFGRTIGPSLNTYLRIEANHSGSNSPVAATNIGSNPKQTNVKFLTWQFKRKKIHGLWDFNVIPDTTASVLPRYRKTIKVRYGCAILLTADPSLLHAESINESIDRQVREVGNAR